MGMEQSIQSSGVFPDLKGYRIKLTGISNVQPNGGASADVAQRAMEEVFVEDVLQGFPSKLEKPEVESVEEASPDKAQEMTAKDSGEETLGQTYQEREKSDFVSVPEEISKAQILGENHQDGNRPVSVPKSAMGTAEESKMTSEIQAASSCSGDNTEGAESPACELDVGGQSSECTMAQQVPSDGHEKPPILSVECELADANVMACLNSEVTAATDKTTNFTEVDLAMPALGVSLASPPLVPGEWTSLQVSAKQQPEIWTTKEPSPIKGIDKAFPGEPTLEEGEVPRVSKSGEGLLSKEGAQISAELRATPVPHQAEAVAEDAKQTQASLGNVGFPGCVEKLTGAPNEQDTLLRPLISEKKKRFCCTVL